MRLARNDGSIREGSNLTQPYVSTQQHGEHAELTCMMTALKGDQIDSIGCLGSVRL